MNEFPEDSALKDRIYSIEIPGYSCKDKVQIVSKYLFPKYLKNINRKSEDIIITEEIAKYLISEYTISEDKGVRTVEKLVKDIINKVHFIVNHPDFNISFKVDSKLTYPVNLTKKMIDKFCKKISKPDNHISTLYL